jgi:arylsulfatase A
MGGKQAVLMGKWKGIKLNAASDLLNQNPIELYDLYEDIGERCDIAVEYPKIIEQIRTIMVNEHVPSETFSFGNENRKTTF